MTARRRARSPPTGLAGVCSRSLCSAAALPCALACDGRCSRARLARGSTAAPRLLPLAANRSSLCAIAARCRVAAPDRAASDSLTADRPGRRLLALAVLYAQRCRALPRSTSRRSRASTCSARPPRRFRSCSPPIAAHPKRSRLAAATPRLAAWRQARSPPTGLVGVCSRSSCSAPALPCAFAYDGRCSRARLVRGPTAAPLPLMPRSPLIAATLHDRGSLPRRRARPCGGGLAHRRLAWSAAVCARWALCAALPRAPAFDESLYRASPPRPAHRSTRFLRWPATAKKRAYRALPPRLARRSIRLLRRPATTKGGAYRASPP